jgi:hypothetical protein
MSDFIDSFPLSDELKVKLRSVGADSPAALLGSLDAAGAAAENFLGRLALQRVRRLLRATLSPRDRKAFAAPLPRQSLGAQLKRPAPVVLPTSFDIGERDRLFTRLQSLRMGLRAGSSSSSAQSELESLESRLNNMMER